MQFSKKQILGVFSIATLSLVACNSSAVQNNIASAIQDSTANKLALETFENPSPEFSDASLNIKNITAELVGTDSAKITFNYDVKNYELGAQTPDATTKGCNNSKDGQHIHFIVNNGPYTALYKPTHTVTVAINQPQYILSFLSRSYHESLKHKGAAQLKHIQVNAQGKIEELPIAETPMVFFSRPKGDYVGQGNVEKVLLDYYIWNTELSATGNQIKATINNEDFLLNTWKPMLITNAQMGELNVTLSLVDKDGKTLEGVHTSVNRKATLAQQEPIK